MLAPSFPFFRELPKFPLQAPLGRTNLCMVTTHVHLPQLVFLCGFFSPPLFGDRIVCIRPFVCTAPPPFSTDLPWAIMFLFFLLGPSGWFIKGDPPPHGQTFPPLPDAFPCSPLPPMTICLCDSAVYPRHSFGCSLVRFPFFIPSPVFPHAHLPQLRGLYPVLLPWAHPGPRLQCLSCPSVVTHNPSQICFSRFFLLPTHLTLESFWSNPELCCCYCPPPSLLPRFALPLQFPFFRFFLESASIFPHTSPCINGQGWVRFVLADTHGHVRSFLTGSHLSRAVLYLSRGQSPLERRPFPQIPTHLFSRISPRWFLTYVCSVC